jgi:hypothetical protein
MGTFVPRLVALTVVWLLATAALTYAASQKVSTPTTTPAATTTAAAAPAILIVPDVRRQAYTFAKGSLSDAGFAWRVVGPVRGYASNVVAAQTPAPGTQLIDTGAPVIVLRLERSGSQLGVPERASAVAGTRVRLAALASAEVKAPARTTKRAAFKKTAKKAAPVVKAKVKVVAERHPRKAPAKRVPARRPPAFLVPGGRREPLAEPALTVRAERLTAWLARHPKATDANVEHWLYQHAWIVAGARMGWWHGATALKTLIAADDRVWALWGIGARSAAIAKQALAEVEARTS